MAMGLYGKHMGYSVSERVVSTSMLIYSHDDCSTVTPKN
ncbi:hypothetical protein BLL52_1858 [Rhodoferax antarcticus ANT.BR]|uniref:Uncharacterized protein n=1 Tax=Rhodoferax antarcticus ANT.BR TaxID=1111071 RepID=A0A1Q8YGK9_9BURK|nr:hypothetical protein BLL52_1858 [Rhodoferax antarcticus ANT.BR]